MFKELPAWGIFVKHAKDIHFENINMECVRKDFRIPVVLDDVKTSTFEGLKISQEAMPQEIYKNNCTGIVVSK